MSVPLGQLAVQRTIEIAASPERIWQEFGPAERMRRWFRCDRLVLEPWVGGRFETEGDHGATRYVFGGRVLVYDPGRELTVEWGWIPPRWPDVSLLTIRLQAVGMGRTRVEILHHGFERLGEGAAEIYRSFESGWDLSELEALKHAVEQG